MLYFSRTRQASAKVVGSGTVGPEAMASSGLPTTSDRMRLTTVAGRARRASWPPLSAERCLRTAFVSTMVAPQRRSAPVIACLSASETPPAGRGINAEPPPEMTTSARSRGVRLARVATMRAAPACPAASGVGWPASTSATGPQLCPGGSRWPYLTLTAPPAIRPPSRPHSAMAIGAPALPPPTIQARS
jgi:hypothetical protein